MNAPATTSLTPRGLQGQPAKSNPVVLVVLSSSKQHPLLSERQFVDLRKHGFDLLSVAEPDLLRDDPTRKLLRQMLGAIAEYEKSMIVLKLRGARQRKKEQTGRCEGRKPFRYYPGEKSVIERMKELRAEGLGFDRVAARLNEEGLRTRTGKPWHGFTIKPDPAAAKCGPEPKQIPEPQDIGAT